MSDQPKSKKVQADEARREQQRLANRGTASRMADHNAVLRATGDRRAAIRAYCAGNRWLEENARAVGNW